MMSDICYQPPVGFVDETYTFVYDAFANNLVDGNTYLNQTVYIPGGYDFVLRRIVGIDSVLATSGQFQWRGSNQENTSSAPITCGTALRDQLIVPEVFFPQTSQIAFDLYNVSKRFGFGNAAGAKVFQAQIGFQGVRRRRVGPMPTPGKFKRVPFILTLPVNTYAQASVTSAGGGATFGAQSVGNDISVNLTVSNYDIEIHMIQCIDTNFAAAIGAGVIPSGMNWFALIPYNAARTALSSAYVLSQFISDGVPFGQSSVGAVGEAQDEVLVSKTLYGVGAVVPPLIYPQETQVKFDLVSLLGNYTATYDWAADATNKITYITLTGFQRVPC